MTRIANHGVKDIFFGGVEEIGTKDCFLPPSETSEQEEIKKWMPRPGIYLCKIPQKFNMKSPFTICIRRKDEWAKNTWPFQYVRKNGDYSLLQHMLPGKYWELEVLEVNE